jgi:predicted transcriptional regulator
MVKNASLRCNPMQQAVSFTRDLRGDMTERPRKATRLTVSLEEQDYRMLNEIALARDASLSWVIRQAIRQFIESTSKAGEKRETRHGDGARGRR